MEAFFEWKKSYTHKARWKEKIAEVQRVADTNMWTTKHLRAMDNPTSTMYRIAMKKGVPDALARGFKEDLKIFKPQWKEARALF